MNKGSIGSISSLPFTSFEILGREESSVLFMAPLKEGLNSSDGTFLSVFKSLAAD
jgi:hypothetical protein